ncbi:NAD(P)-dependent oxidoreductase [Clostridium septicum]|uniref:precorrin-2 dehydrogenase n=1 Tax=Clostridium septicum TaxID=1504 RepID=A0A9N7JJT8_CLOSE|nr:NAD(P)-dependent oxidoreductase [Clostridium septicum]AYE33544.1 precorrin-2 dehydrogenase [Clostridium septicum]QAS61707.1 NAD(P)-dependent oxidoreductase [Clostridium septicum]UEC21846.1 NAD(P)-dependent oxidoreductase [Clostridium septicum]USS00101.1 NAD(P)-dependent oxidoreductase [Clostridium septicum]WLF68648.1 NAD(P)-dependent oxidoreductase [Clostridium septicum]
MSKNIKKDISNIEKDYIYLSLKSDSLRIGIIGGGKAALIKARSFLKKGCFVEIISKNFNEELLSNRSDCLKLNQGSYSKEFIEDKHIVVIAVDDYELVEKIIVHCDESSKIYVNATDFKNGKAIIPVQRESKNLNFAVSTKLGNPKGALLVANKALSILEEYDEFIEYSSKVRNNAKYIEEYKKEIIDFVCTEDFKFIYNIKKHKEVLTMFFNEDIINKLYK